MALNAQMLLLLAGVLIAGHPAAASCSDGDVRLYGGATDGDGMVQQCNSTGQWEAVCDLFWDCSESVVVCRQLGHNDTVATFNTNFGPWTSIGFGPYACSPSDTSLDQCTAIPQYLGSSNCRAQSDTVQVDCTHLLTSDGCTNGHVRLVDGTSTNEGRVEYCNAGSWSALCTDYSFSHATAHAVCRTLGYVTNSYGLVFIDGTYGRGDMVNAVGYISCFSNSITINDCIMFKQSGCGHACPDTSQYHGLRCFEPTGCNEGEIRLADGVIENEGRVEICVNGVWSSVCDNDFDATDGHIVCSELGHTQGAIAYHDSTFGGGYGPIAYSNLACQGQETDLTDCPSSTYFQFTCYNTDTAGVLCVDGCKEGDVRIRDGKPYGSVEVCINEIWGLIGDQGWDDDDARVVCRQLGYASRGVGVGNSTYGKPRRAVHLNNVHCTGSEDSLLDCNYHQYLLNNGKSLLDLVEVVGVDCRAAMTTVSDSSTSFSTTSALSTTTTNIVVVATSGVVKKESHGLMIAVLACIVVLMIIVVISVIVLAFIILRSKKVGSVALAQPVYYMSDGNTIITNNRNDTPTATPTHSYNTISSIQTKLPLSPSGTYANAEMAPNLAQPPPLPPPLPSRDTSDTPTPVAPNITGKEETLYDN